MSHVQNRQLPEPSAKTSRRAISRWSLMYADLKDGLSNIFMIGECRPDEYHTLWTYELEEYHCLRDNQVTNVPSLTGAQHWACYNGGAAHFTTIIPINYRSDVKKNCSAAYTSDHDPDPEVQAHSYGDWNVAAGFKSRHPGGANFLFADGSVHFLPEDINHTTYQYLGCRDDGRHLEEIP